MSHENIVKLDRICASSAESVYLVFEYLDFDLAGLLQHPSFSSSSSSSPSPSSSSLGVAQIKCIMQQLLSSLKYLHANGVVHRDIKGSNILLGRDGQVKLADFGLAKVYRHPDKNNEQTNSSNRIMTNRVITLWYRPPEILLGSTTYGPEVDIWGAGCILLDLLAGRPIFTGQDELTQLDSICRRLGPLPPDLMQREYPWLQMMLDALPNEQSSPASPADVDFLQDEYGDQLGPDGVDLLRGLLALDPRKRISAEDALVHRYFSVHPQACPQSLLIPSVEGDWHEYECKQRKPRPVDISSR